jgi:ABC-type bacteriocin/lantibiotic exporter with double-glycine peptidase domain
MLVWGVYLIDAKVITGGALMGGVMFAMRRAVAPLSSVMLATRYQGARAAMLALNHVMAQPVEREPGRSTCRGAASAAASAQRRGLCLPGQGRRGGAARC